MTKPEPRLEGKDLLADLLVALLTVAQGSLLEALLAVTPVCLSVAALGARLEVQSAAAPVDMVAATLADQLAAAQVDQPAVAPVGMAAVARAALRPRVATATNVGELRSLLPVGIIIPTMTLVIGQERTVIP